ncbi:hypothetical protein FQA47_022862 [Oryzias melastigma]|uniref:Uncharacterized protein n=1 Tax=Oryzias melastigma TaxID=30732 RepID=A0A834CAM8_ORYME|nr:hypothetical protein FQA47_022862 [Oryzias melastigma]
MRSTYETEIQQNTHLCPFLYLSLMTAIECSSMRLRLEIIKSMCNPQEEKGKTDFSVHPIKRKGCFLYEAKEESQKMVTVIHFILKDKEASSSSPAKLSVSSIKRLFQVVLKGFRGPTPDREVSLKTFS